MPVAPVVFGYAVHEGILLRVDHGSKQVVPEGEAEGPVSPKLSLGSALHGCRPCVDAHVRCVGVSNPAAPGALLFIAAGCCCGALDVRARGAVLEAEAEGRGEVERLELVHQSIARAHLKGRVDLLVP